MARKRRINTRTPSGIPEIDEMPVPPRRFTPADWEEMQGKTPECSARTKHGMPCNLPAGYGTDHFGVGRCIYHDNRADTDGRRSAPLLFYLDPELRNAVATYVNTDEVLNLRTELAVLRVRFAEINNYDFDNMDPTEARRWLREMTNLSKEIARLTETVTTLERGLHKYVHISVTGNILAAVADVTRNYIEPSRMEEFMQDLAEAVKSGMSVLSAKEVAVSALLPDVTQYVEHDKWQQIIDEDNGEGVDQ